MTTVEASTLADALKTCAPALPTRGGSLPVTEGVRLETTGDRLRVTCTDLDTTITTTVPCDPGDGLDSIVPARMFRSFVEQLDGAASIEVDRDDLRLSGGAVEVSLRTLRGDEWPKIPEVAGDPVKVSAETLALVGRVLHAASTDMKARPLLCTVEFGEVTVCATDSHRLARAEIDHELPEMLVPAAALPPILAKGESGAVVATDGHRAIFETGSTRTIIRLASGQFPKWPQLIPPTPPHSISIDRTALLDALDLLAPISVGAKAGAAVKVTIEPGDGEVRLRAHAQDLGDATVTIAAEVGCADTWGVNHRFLRQLVEATAADTVRFGITSPLKPVVVIDGPLLQLVVPIKL